MDPATFDVNRFDPSSTRFTFPSGGCIGVSTGRFRLAASFSLQMDRQLEIRSRRNVSEFVVGEFSVDWPCCSPDGFCHLEMVQ